jgi:hypothetical protein
VNLLHNVAHLAFGIWGLAVSRNAGATVVYARGVAVIYAAFTVLGLIPSLNTAFGLVPLHGNDVWLHALLAAIAAYFVSSGTTSLGRRRPRRRRMGGAG